MVLAKKPENRPRLEDALELYCNEIQFACSVHISGNARETAEEMARQLGLRPKREGVLFKWNEGTPQTQIEKGPGLFPRIESKPQGAERVSESACVPTTDKPSRRPPANIVSTTATAAPQSQQRTPIAASPSHGHH